MEILLIVITSLVTQRYGFLKCPLIIVQEHVFMVATFMCWHRKHQIWWKRFFTLTKPYVKLDSLKNLKSRSPFSVISPRFLGSVPERTVYKKYVGDEQGKRQQDGNVRPRAGFFSKVKIRTLLFRCVYWYIIKGYYFKVSFITDSCDSFLNKL